MNTTVKVAALVSVLVFGGIIGIFLAMDPGKDLQEEKAGEFLSASVTGSSGGETGSDGTARVVELPRAEKHIRGSVQLSVEVRDTTRNIPLRAANVRAFKKSEADSAQSEIPDLWANAPHTGNGKVSFALAPGTYDIRAQCLGYTGDRQSVTLIKGKEADPIVFHLQRGTSISGVVLDGTRDPIAGARVFAFKELSDPEADIEEILRSIVGLNEYTNTVHSETISDTDGRFQLDGLENYWYTVRAVAPSFTPGEVAAVRAPNSKSVEIILQPGSEISGAVRDPDGRPVENARVMAFKEPVDASLFQIIMDKARPPVEEYTTGADGTYKLQSLGAGLYNFLVAAPAFQEHREMKYRIAAGSNKAKNFVMQPGHLIEGYVRGPEDEPVSGASVRANPIGVAGSPSRDQIRIEMKDRDIKTDENGYFRFDTLVDARYMLIVFHDDYESLQRKDVRPDGDQINLRLGLGAQIHGMVIDSNTSEPIPGASISASDLANLRKEGTTDQGGQFVLSGLGSNRRPVTVYVMADGYAREKRQVSVRKDRKHEENFELHQTGFVEGVVVDSSGSPLSGAHVEVRPTLVDGGAAARVLGNGQSGSDGVFVIHNVEPGEGLQVRIKLQAYLETFSATFSLESGERHNAGQIELQFGGEISGVVKTQDGTPINGVWIEARPDGGTDLTPGGSVQSDGGGRFLLRGLKAGKYDLIAKANGYIETALRGIEARESFHNGNNDIVMEQGGLVSGSVVSTDGSPVQGAEVVARDFGDGIQERRVVTDGKGRFELNNIIAKDEIELSVSHPDYDGYTNKALAVGTKELEVRLTPLGSLVGIVLDPAGSPMDSFTVQPQSVARDRRKGKSRLRPKTFNPQDGRFEYRGLPDGVYSVFVRSLKFSAVTLDNVEVRAGEVVDVGEIRLAEGGTVSGTVVTAGTNQPVAGARVRVTQGARAFASKATVLVSTETDGSFVISGLKDQVISLDVSHGEFASQKVTGVDPRVGSKSQNLRVELEQPGRIVGVVVGEDGGEAKGVTVYLVAKRQGGRNDSRNSGADGSFEFQKVASGAYTLRAHRFGKAGAQIDVQIFSGEAIEVTLQLGD